MSRFISKDGVWHPANEKVALTNHKTGEPYIYEGPDRAALYELFQQKVENLGNDFRFDSELINRIRQLGYKDIDEYLQFIGYDSSKVELEFKKNASKINKHELPERIASIEKMGGGTDTSGQGNDIPGGFGKPKDL
jgi:hypothetical protein